MSSETPQKSFKNLSESEKIEHFKKKCRERSGRYRKNQLSDPDKAAEFLKRRSIQASQSIKRKKKKLKRGYKTKKGLKGAVKRVEAKFPKDKHRKKQLVQNLAEKHLGGSSQIFQREQEHSSDDNQEKDSQDETGEQDVEEPEVFKKVKLFYERDDISRMMPGIKDFKSVKNPDGKRQKIQKRYLTMTVEDAWRLYCVECGENCISRSSFAKLRPEHIQLAAKTPHDVCCCRYHQDFELIFDSLSKITDNFNCLKELVIKLVCSRDNYDCMASKCPECADFIPRLMSYFDASLLSKSTTLEQWNVTSIPVREVQSCRVIDVLDIFKKKFPAYKLHSHVTTVQHEFLRQYKSDIEEHQAILQMDFAENFTITFQNEIQQAHFKQRQVALFTAHATMKNSQQAYVVVSDDLDHSKYAVFNFKSAIMKDMRAKNPVITETLDCTDGCAQQFKNKFTISLLGYTQEDFGVMTEHMFMSSGHGKGPHDGHGGNLKRRIRERVLSGGTNVVDAKSFYEAAIEICDKIVVLFVSKEDIENSKPLLDTRWNNVKSMDGIRACHHFIAKNRNEIKASVTSRGDSPRTFKIHK